MLVDISIKYQFVRYYPALCDGIAIYIRIHKAYFSEDHNKTIPS